MEKDNFVSRINFVWLKHTSVIYVSQSRTIIHINNNNFLKYFKCIPKKLENIVGQMTKIHTYVVFNMC